MQKNQRKYELINNLKIRLNIIYIGMEKFNKNLEQFIRNLTKINGDENYLEHYNFTDPGDKYLNIFYKNCGKFSNDIANKDEIIF